MVLIYFIPAQIWGNLKKTVHHLAFGSLVSIPLDPWISLKQCKCLLGGLELDAGSQAAHSPRCCWVPGEEMAESCNDVSSPGAQATGVESVRPKPPGVALTLPGPL